MEFHVVYFSSCSQVVLSFAESVLVVVACMVYCPSASGGSVLEFGSVGVYDDGVIVKGVEPFFMEV
jgi:hypothetical protein